MRYVTLLFAAVLPIFADTTFTGCSIAARWELKDGTVTKDYACDGGVVRLSGKWDTKPDLHGKPAYREFGEFWFGEKRDFGAPAAKVQAHYRNCRDNGSTANKAGYMSQASTWDCGGEGITLSGQWGIEIQGKWQYHLQLGEVYMEPDWVDDVADSIKRSSSYQKWCPTKYGYRLCGWVDQPRVDHGKAPLFRRQ